MSSISWTDGIGAASLDNSKPYPAARFANWNPSNRPFGERSQNLGTGALNVTAFRDDLTVSLDITGIPNSSQALMLRLQMHLKRGGSVEINPSDPTIPLFGTCKLAPGADVQIQLSDKTNLEYTFSTVLRGVGVLTTPPGVVGGDFYIWYKADAVSVVGPEPADTTPLSQWKDSAPFANHATQPFAIQQPKIEYNSQNGLPCVRFRPAEFADFDHADRMVVPDCLSGRLEGEAILVHKRTFIGGADHTNTLFHGLWLFAGSISGQYSKYPQDVAGVIQDSFCTDVTHVTDISPVDVTTPHIYGAVSKPGEWTNRINGNVLWTTATNTVTMPKDHPTSPQAHLGTSTNDGFYSSWSHWFEFLFTSPARTPSQRDAFHSYVNTKWDLGL